VRFTGPGPRRDVTKEMTIDDSMKATRLAGYDRSVLSGGDGDVNAHSRWQAFK
jgi:hypothetical protein